MRRLCWVCPGMPWSGLGKWLQTLADCRASTVEEGGASARAPHAALGLCGLSDLDRQLGSARLNEGGPWLLDPRCVLEQREESHGPWSTVAMMRRVCWDCVDWRWSVSLLPRVGSRSLSW
jgi:hypothetical protein